MKGKQIIPTELLSSWLGLLNEFTDAWDKASLISKDNTVVSDMVETTSTALRQLLAIEIDMSQQVQDFCDAMQARHDEGDPEVTFSHCAIMNVVSAEIRRLNLLHIDEFGSKLGMDLGSADRD